MTEKERNHYIPKFYLDGFANNGFIYVYDRDDNVYRYQSTKDTAVIKNYYTAIKPDGTKDKRIEDYFNFIEKKAAKIINKIDNQEKIDEIEKVYLSLFISYCRVRGPDFEKFFNESHDHFAKVFLENITKNPNSFEEVISDYQKESGTAIEYNISELIEVTKKMKLEVPKEYRLQMMLDFGFSQAKIINNMGMLIQSTVKDTSYIASDNPFIFWSEGLKQENEVVGLITPDTVKVIPLSMKSCLLIFNYDSKINFLEYMAEKTSKSDTRIVNQTIAFYSDRFIFGRDKSLLKKIVKSINLNTYKTISRSQLEFDNEKKIFKLVKKNIIEKK